MKKQVRKEVVYMELLIAIEDRLRKDWVILNEVEDRLEAGTLSNYDPATGYMTEIYEKAYTKMRNRYDGYPAMQARKPKNIKIMVEGLKEHPYFLIREIRDRQTEDLEYFDTKLCNATDAACAKEIFLKANDPKGRYREWVHPKELSKGKKWQRDTANKGEHWLWRS